MALEILPDDSGYTIGPRISFSGNLSQADRFCDREDYHREDSFLLEVPSSTDFHFCTPEEKYSSSADQLFYNGKILPVAPICSPPRRFTTMSSRSESLKEMFDKDKKPASQPISSKALWELSRSNSLNCRCITKSGFLSTLNRLTRSSSAGRGLKATTTKKSPPAPPSPPVEAPTKPGKKQSPKKKEYNNSVKINPVLNVPPPFISRGKSSLFSFGYFLCKKEKTRSLF